MRAAMLLLLSWLLASPALAGPLDAIWVGVPGTRSAGAPNTQRVSIRTTGPVFPGVPPHLLVRITYDCGTGSACTTSESPATYFGLIGPGSFEYAVTGLSAPAPRPAFVFFFHPGCSATLGVESLVGVWAGGSGPQLGECFYRQPAPQKPRNPLLDKIQKPMPVPSLPPLPPPPRP